MAHFDDLRFYQQLFDASADAVVVVDDHGVIRLQNHQVSALFGWQPGDLVGRPVEILVPAGLKRRHADLRAEYERHPTGRAMESGAHLHAVRADGSEFPVDVSLTPIETDGHVMVAAAVRDATARTAAEARIVESEQQLRTSLDSMLDGFVIARAVRDGTAIVDFEWAYVNDVGVEAFGIDRDAMLGTRMLEVIPMTRSRGFPECRDVVETGVPWSATEMAYDDDGLSGAYDIRVWRLGDGFAATWRNVTDRARAEQELRVSEERFRASVDHLHDALAVFSSIRDEHGGITDFRWEYANLTAASMAGHTQADIEGRTLLDVLPEHGPSGLIDAYRRVVETGEPWVQPTLWYEADWADGTHARRAFDVRVTKVHDGIVVVTREVTAEREHEQRLERQRTELERTNAEILELNELGDLLASCVAVDEAYAVTARAAGHLLPRTHGLISTLPHEGGSLEVAAIWGSATPVPPPFAATDCWALRRGQPHVSGSQAPRCPHLLDSPVSRCLCVPMIGQGETIGVLHVLSDEQVPDAEPAQAYADRVAPLATTIARQVALAARNLQLRDRLRDLSIRDPLTGLFNRRYMEETLHREIARAGRTHGHLAVLQADLDHFKECNDAHGHAAGDAVLHAVAVELQSTFRASDVICRFGGEEFTVILPDCDTESALIQAEALRRRVGALVVRHERVAIGGQTISIGVASYPAHATNAGDLVNAADAALYVAKDEGRDRVVLANDRAREGRRSRTA